MKILITLISFVVISGCATGEKWNRIEEGMDRKDVQRAIGKQDQIVKKQNGWSVHYYKDRLISGWSWDKTDYYVVYNSDGKVDSYGPGEIDTRTSDRMSSLRVISNVAKPVQMSCETTNQFGKQITECNGK